MGKRRWVTYASLVVLLFASGMPFAQARGGPPASENGDRFVPRRAIVGVSGSNRPGAEAAIRGRGGRILSFYAPGYFYIVQTPSQAPAWAASVRGRAGVRYAEPDLILQADEVVPDDPLWDSQWGPQTIGAPSAWDVTTGSSDVVVGVVDSGVDYTHEDLASQMWVNPGEIPEDGIDNDGNGFVDDVHGADCRNLDGDPMDDYFHGTHVAGILGAAGNNRLGIAGTAWGVRIMALKFLDSSGSGSVTDAIACIDYAIAHGASLTNNSYSTTAYSQALYDSVGRARAAGQVFVASAGNAARNTDTGAPVYPADLDLDNILSVAASDQTDSLAAFSNFGTMTVDLASPGVGILSTIPGNGYASFSGTSMAAPGVAGAAALILSAYPGLTYPAVIDRIAGSVDPSPSLAGKVATGGRLNLARAVEPDTTPPGSVNLLLGARTRNSIVVKWSAPAEDGATGGSVSSYALRYAPTETEAWSGAPAPAPASTGTMQNAKITGLRPGTQYDISLAAKDNVGHTSTAVISGTTGAGTEIFFDDLESGAPGWTAEPSWGITPEQAHSPTGSWSDSPHGPYADNTEASILTPSFSLVGASNPTLSFWERRLLQQSRDFGYVHVSTDGGATWTQLARYTGATDYRAVTINLGSYVGSPDVRVRFRLTSDGMVVNDGWFLDDVLVSGDDVTPPAPPQGLTATPSDARVALDWADNSEPDLGSYRVYRTTDAPEAPTRTWTAVSTVSASNTTDTGLANLTTYYYRVTALDAVGNESGPSEEVAATPVDEVAPASPQGLIATPSDGQVALDWADNPEPDLASYRIFRSTDAPGAPTRSWALIATVGASNATDTGLANLTTYYYRVTAIDSVGNESAPSEEVSGTPNSSSIQVHAATKVTVSIGSSLGDPLGNLAQSDDQYLGVASALGGGKQKVDWSGSATIDPAGATRLTVTYEGSWTEPATQKLYVRNWAAGTWELISSTVVSTADATFTWFTTSPASYVSNKGEVRFRVTSIGTAQVTCWADLMQFTVDY